MNWFEIALITLAWVVFIKSEEFSHHNQRILRAVLILFSAFEFLQIIGTLPILSFSTHMVMLKRVSITFLKSIFLYSILLLSFGLSFYTLFGESHVDPASDEYKSEYIGESDSNDTILFAAQDIPDKQENKNSFESFQNPGIAIVRVFVMLTGESI